MVLNNRTMPVLAVCICLISIVIKEMCWCLEARGPRLVHNLPDQVDFSNDTSRTVSCQIQGNPTPQIKWIRSDGSIVSAVANLLDTLSNGSLRFLPFSAKDYRHDIHATVYRCMAANPLGTVVSNDVRIRAAVKQFYEIQVYDHYVIQANTAVLTCQIPPFIQEFVVFKSWEREHHKGAETISENGRYSVFPDGVLHVRDMRRDGSVGYTFRCRTQHRLTGEMKRSVSAGKVIVTEQKGSVSPQIVHALSTVEARHGDKVRLPCVAQGLPVPHYRWEKLRDGHSAPVKLSEKHHVIDGTLVIRNVQIEDSGTYLCIADNSVGVEQAETILTVTVPLSAYIQPEIQEVDEGKAATFACTTSGHPVTFVSWIKDGKFLAMDDRVKLLSREILRIESVRRKDRGMYQCIARNDQSSVQASAELKLGDSAPVLLDVFREQTVHTGSPLSLKCEASGNPPLVAQWRLDDANIASANFVNVKEDVVSYVNITKAMAEDGGQYECIMTNRVGTIRHSARINVHGPPVVRIMPNVSAVAGRDAVLRCRASGYPIDSIHWEKDGHTLPTNHRQKVFSNGTLIIQEVNGISDAGYYSCVANNRQGQSAQRPVHLSILNAPVINPFSFPNNLRVGVRAGVQCLITEGDQPIAINWLKDDRPIPSDVGITTKILDELTRSLIISSITPWHNGNYTCVASNGADSVRHTAQLRVNVPPRWSMEPQNSSVILQRPHHLDCQAEGSPVPTVTWKKAIGRTPRDYKLVNLLSISLQEARNGSLLIRSAQVGHEGYYLCQVGNGVGPELSKVVYLDVQVPTYFEDKLRNQSVIKGKDAHLHCTAKGDDPITIEWRTMDNVISSNTPRFLIKDRTEIQGFTSELLIFRVDRLDTNVYHCDATNPYGHDRTKIYLLIKEPPEAPKTPTILSKDGRSAHISWKTPFDGNSAILRYIVQYKSSRESWDKAQNSSVTGMENAVTLQALRPATVYQIRVFAENDIGVGAASGTVALTMNEEAPEGTPLDVRIEATDSRSLKVIWKPPKRELWNGDIQGYRIGYRDFEAAEPFTFKTHLSSTTSFDQPIQYEITDLKKFNKYGIVIEAYNVQGAGPRTNEHVATTLEDVPSKPPQAVKCTTMSSQALRLDWEAPPSFALHGLLRGYKINYESSALKEEKFTKSTTQQSAMLDNLLKFANYTLTLSAFNGAGDGATSDPVVCSTDEDVPGAPAEIKALVMSSDAILLSWRPPLKPNGHITKYTVYTRANGHRDTKPVSHTVPPSQLYYEGRGLEEELHYEFWTTASTSVGEGQSTPIVSQSPTSIVPARIASFPDAIEMDRKEDVKFECRAVGIPTPDREWRLRGERIHEKPRFQIGQDGSLIISTVRVHDSNNYTCRVTNIYATDEITYELTVKGPIGKDAPPSIPNLEVKSRTENSLQVYWSLDEDGRNPIRGYTLHRKENDGEWSEVVIDAENDSHTLEGLKCGTNYQLYVTAKNQIGTSEPSDTVLTTTKGHPPEKPDRDTFLRINSTSLGLDLTTWPDGGCPITDFIIEYRMRQRQVEWEKMVHDPTSEHKYVVIQRLTPETAYSLRVTAKNDAGPITADYDITTLPDNTGKSLSDYSLGGSSSAGLLGYVDLDVIIPVATIAGIIIVLTAAIICIALQCRRYVHHKTGGSARQVMMLALSPGRNVAHREPEVQSKTVKTEVGKSQTSAVPSCYIDSGVHDDICPYATYQLPTCNANDPANMQLRTFSQARNFEEGWVPTKITSKLLHTNKKDPPPSTEQQQESVQIHRTEQSVSLTSSQKSLMKDTTGRPLTPPGMWLQRDRLEPFGHSGSTTLIPSAPPAEGDISLTPESERGGGGGGGGHSTRTIERHGGGQSSSSKNKQLHRVPDLLYHRQDSSTSNDCGGRGDTLDGASFLSATLKKEEADRRLAARFVTAQPQQRASINWNQSCFDAISPSERPPLLGSPIINKSFRPPSGCGSEKLGTESTANSQPDSTKSSLVTKSGLEPVGKTSRNLAAEEEALIALLKRGHDKGDAGSKFKKEALHFGL